MTVGLYFPTLWYYGLPSLVQTAKTPHAFSPSPADEGKTTETKNTKTKNTKTIFQLYQVPTTIHKSPSPRKEERPCFLKGRWEAGTAGEKEKTWSRKIDTSTSTLQIVESCKKWGRAGRGNGELRIPSWRMGERNEKRMTHKLPCCWVGLPDGQPSPPVKTVAKNENQGPQWDQKE